MRCLVGKGRKNSSSFGGAENHPVATLWRPIPGLHLREPVSPNDLSENRDWPFQKRMLSCGFVEVEAWLNPFRTYGVVLSEKFVMTFPVPTVGCVGRYSPSLGVHGSWLCRCLGIHPLILDAVRPSMEMGRVLLSLLPRTHFRLGKFVSLSPVWGASC